MCAALYYSGGGDPNSVSPFSINAVVLDIGSYSTKMGWAGDDYPRSYFRSNVAVCRETNDKNNNNNNNNNHDTSMMMDTTSNDDPAAVNRTTQQQLQLSSCSKTSPNRGLGRIRRGGDSIRYDYYTRSILLDGTDGEYEPCNPIDPATGLFYQSMNSNYDYPTTNNNTNENIVASNQQQQSSSSPVDDWYDLLQQFVQHSYNTAIRGFVATDHPILMTERAYNIPAIRQQITECIFEEVQAPAFFLSKDAVLQCYGVGRTSAISVDLGYSGVTVAPVYDGYVEATGIRRCPIGLRAVDELILQQMDQLYLNQNHPSKKKINNYHGIMPLYQIRSKTKAVRKESIHTAARLFLAQECRESGAGASINTVNTNTNPAPGQQQQQQQQASSSSTSTFHAPNKSFELPDGTILDIPSADRFRAADYLFGNNLNHGLTVMLPGNSHNTNKNNPVVTIQSRREKVCDEMKHVILSYCTATTNALSALQQQQSTTKKSTIEENQAFLAQQTAAALGIVSRKQQQQQQHHYVKKRSVDGQFIHPDGSTTKTNGSNYEAYIKWHRACLSDLRTLASERITSTSIANMICDAAYKCDRDQQASLLGNVVVGGGGAACLGPTETAVPDLIKENVESLIHTHTPGWRVKVFTPNVMNERAVLPWIGGSILGSLSTFHNMWITKAEYEEWGSAIVNRKCP